MARQSKSERKLERECIKVYNALQCLDAGKLDHMFADAETKAAAREDLMHEWGVALRKYIRAFPGQFCEYADGTIGLVSEGSNVVPLPPRGN
jgi:hypothetical protein